MKTNLLRKAKWYVIGLILIAVMLSVSLSFCAWDTLSIKASMRADGGSFADKYGLVADNNGNKIADVGDIVTYGRYYQEIDENGGLLPKTPIRWVVVDKVGGVLTLYSEKIMAYGSFFGTWYYKEDGERVYGVNTWLNQNYTESNVRKWLNSDTTPRGDGGKSFSQNSMDRVTFRGFYSEAFSDFEKDNIINKRISGMSGYGLIEVANTGIEPFQYGECNDKVWLPSASEIMGKDTLTWANGFSDGQPNTQFKYFELGNKMSSARTRFSYSSHSNYTMPIVTNESNFYETNYWLRSSSLLGADWSACIISGDNLLYPFATSDSYNGIRPAICIPIS